MSNLYTPTQAMVLGTKWTGIRKSPYGVQPLSAGRSKSKSDNSIIGPVSPEDFNSIAARLRATEGDVQSEIANAPPEVNPYQLQADQAQAQLAGIPATVPNEPVYQQPTDYAPPPRPAMTYPNMPDRPTPQLNPVAGGLAALGGLIVPGQAGNFGAAAIHAANREADQTYADRMKQFQYNLQQAEQTHSEALQSRDEQIRFALENLTGKAKNDYAKSVAGYHDALLQGNHDAMIATLHSQIDALSKVAGQQDKYTIHANKLKGLIQQKEDQIRQLAGMSQAYNAYEKNKAFLEGAQLKSATSMTVRDMTNENNLAMQDKRNAGSANAATIRAGATVNAAKIRAAATIDAASKRIGSSSDPSVSVQRDSFRVERNQLDKAYGVASKVVGPNSFASPDQKAAAQQVLNGLDKQYSDLAKRITGYADSLKKAPAKGASPGVVTRKQFAGPDGQPKWFTLKGGKWVPD